MFKSLLQSFDDASDGAHAAERLAALRRRLAAAGVDGFVVPRADPHQNEYVPPSEERLRWLTGFTGSAGIAVVLAETAAIFIDGRYTAQAREQVDSALFIQIDIGTTTPADWLRTALPQGARLGYDPWLHTAEAAGRLAKACADAGATLVPLDTNPIDAIWQDRPAPPCAPVVLRGPEFAGEAVEAKIARVRQEIERRKADVLLLTDPHAIAWLFNVRGADVDFTPLPLAWAALPVSGRPTLLIDGRKLSNAVRDALAAFADVGEPAMLDTMLGRFGADKARVLLDAATAAQAIAARLEAAGATVASGADPVAALKAVKNEVEIAGSRTAHLRDGAALVRFLAWLDREAPSGALTEIDAAAALETFRRETGLLKDLSFPTISAAGPNAALPHYRVTRATNRPITPGLFLIDSGAQYLDGTTDVTRTIVIGEADALMSDRFTRVLKGHIAIATATFPKGATGAQLDPFARRALWDAGTDFDHGTGHGVGSYLSVHEGPARISKLGHVPLEPGMILSNEPGYYREGQFGIRTENLVLVRHADLAGAERPMLAFETLTLAPIDRRAIETSLLTRDEIGWLDGYHARVFAEIGPLLDETTRNWLAASTRPLGD